MTSATRFDIQVRFDYYAIECSSSKIIYSMFWLIVAGAIATAFYVKAPIGPAIATLLIVKGANIRFVGFGKTFDLISSDPPLSEKTDSKKLPEPLKSKELSVLSHNLWCHYLQSWYVPSSAKRLKGFLKCLEKEDIDIVCLQEIFLIRFGPFAHTANFDLLAKGMRELGYRYFTDPRPSLPWFGQNSGLAIFSRLPFLAPPSASSFRVTGERVCVKGFVHAQVRPPGLGRTLHVVTTHLDSKTRPAGVRHTQARQLMDSTVGPALASDRDAWTVVVGDFNVCSRGTKDQGEGYIQLKQDMLPLTDLYDGPPATIAPTRRPSTKPWQRGKAKGRDAGALDHAFVSAGLAANAAAHPARVVDWRCAGGGGVSDHLGLHFTLPPASSAAAAVVTGAR